MHHLLMALFSPAEADKYKLCGFYLEDGQARSAIELLKSLLMSKLNLSQQVAWHQMLAHAYSLQEVS